MPVFRVHGYPPDAPETFLLLEAFSGSVKQFYLGQARNYSLAAGQQWAKSVDRGDHQIRYVASGGTEIVTLKVHPERARRILTGDEAWWDSALVEITIPSTNEVLGLYAAFMTAPVLEVITVDSYLPVKGVARDLYGWDAWGAAHRPDLIVAYPDPDGAPDYYEADRYTQTASLRVDLRPFRGFTTIAIELWGMVTPSSVPVLIDSEFKGYFARKRNDAVHPWPAEYVIQAPDASSKNNIIAAFPEYEAYGDSWVNFGSIAGVEDHNIYWVVPGVGFFGGPLTEAKWNAGYWSSLTPEDYAAAYSPEELETEWAPGIRKTYKRVRYGVYRADIGWVYNETLPTPPPYIPETERVGLEPGVYRFPVQSGDTTELWTPLYGSETILEGRPGTVSGALFLGNPWDKVAEYVADGYQLRQWEISAVYPQRPNLGTLGEVTVPAIDDYGLESTLQNKWNMQKLGTVYIDPRRIIRDPRRPGGGITFKPV